MMGHCSCQMADQVDLSDCKDYFNLRVWLGLERSLNVRGILKYRLEVIWIGHVDQWLCDEGCLMMFVG